jgi:hypothetical protein
MWEIIGYIFVGVFSTVLVLALFGQFDDDEGNPFK